jgi:hypothetical protein
MKYKGCSPEKKVSKIDRQAIFKIQNLTKIDQNNCAKTVDAACVYVIIMS